MRNHKIVVASGAAAVIVLGGTAATLGIAARRQGVTSVDLQRVSDLNCRKIETLKRVLISNYRSTDKLVQARVDLPLRVKRNLHALYASYEAQLGATRC